MTQENCDGTARGSTASRGRGKRWAWYAAAFCSAACAAPVDELPSHAEEPPAIAAQASAPAVRDLVAKVVGARFSGTLCPANSVGFSFPGDGESGGDGGWLNTRFSEQVESDASPVTRACTLEIDLEVPAGYQFRNMRTQWLSSLAALPELPHAANVVVRYALDGQPAQTFTWTPRNTFHPPPPGEPSETISKHTVSAWSTCGRERSRPSRVRLRVDVSLTAENASLTASTFDVLNLTYDGGLQWRRCGTTQPLTPPPAAAGETCAGPSRHACESGLVCERESNAVRLLGDDAAGRCVARSGRVSAAKRDEACGGVRSRPCEAGLLCHYPSRELATPETTGLCTPGRPQPRDAACGGYPRLECASGLRCAAESKITCQPS